MTAEEALYWKGYIDKIVTEKLAVLNSSQQDAIRIRQFAESYMGGITGQQLLPQSVFRKFLELFSHIPATQGNIEQMQETLNETVEQLREAGDEIADQAENINNIEKVYYKTDEEYRSNFYHRFDAEWAERALGDDFNNLDEDDIINELYDELVGLDGAIHIVSLDFRHRGVASCSYILFRYNTGRAVTGRPSIKLMLLSVDGYYTWSVRVNVRTRVRTISNSWQAYALQTDEERQRDVVVVNDYTALQAIDVAERDTDVIYRTIDDDKLWLWNEENFVEVGGGEAVDNTIYVTNLDDIFEMNLTSGVYTIAYNHKVGMRYYTDIYSLVVNKYRIGLNGVSRLILSNSDGWAEVADDGDGNLEWEWHLYAYKDDVQATVTKVVRKSNAVAQRSTEKKEVVEVASYAALLAIEEPEKETIYVTTDEHKLYVYTDEGFIDAASGDDDNIIYVSDLDELMDLSLASGSYQVCHTYLKDGEYTTDNYVLSVAEAHSGNEVTRTLTLADINGWAEVVDDTWVWHNYVYQENITEIGISDINALFTN